jgi:CheY-like chemotaxis protein
MAPQPRPQSASISELEIKNVLLVDDDFELADTLKALLESHNYVVTTVVNGVEALREVMRIDFDVIICDLLMPEMPGLASRFLFITGYADNPKVEAFLKRINGLVLQKPVLTEDLVRMISLILKRNAE